MCDNPINMPIQLFFSGAIFTQEDKDSTTEVAFKYAVYRINKDKAILPNTTLVYDIEYVSSQDSFKASKKGTLKYDLIDKCKQNALSVKNRFHFFFFFTFIQLFNYMIFNRCIRRSLL